MSWLQVCYHVQVEVRWVRFSSGSILSLALYSPSALLISVQADKEMSEYGKIPDKLKGAGSFLMKVFGALAVCDTSTLVSE